MEIIESKTDVFFDNLRKKEYSRLDESRHVYLDYTGGNLYPESLVDMHHLFLKQLFSEIPILLTQLRNCRKSS